MHGRRVVGQTGASKLAAGGAFWELGGAGLD